ncbi:MAG TPA: cytochrome c peroxidase [Polyangiaceae bacterium]|nr:cytochrome c peroxidase [Polyangiaceae bacterium]
MPGQKSRVEQLLGASTAVHAPAGVNAAVWKGFGPADAKGSVEEVELGKKLYFEVRLSKDGTVACATCHDVSRGFTDRRNTSEGIGDQLGRRNAPTTMNAALFTTQFWDGRAKTLDDQARLPITNPIEMGMKDEAAAVAAIAQDPAYVSAFQKVYGKAPNMDDLARALAAFERTLIFLDSPFDRFLRGDDSAISADARAGWALFNGKGRCNSCHQMSTSQPLGTDQRFHNIGVSARHQDFEGLAKKSLAALAKDASAETIDRLALETDMSELGRFVVTRNRGDIGSFKTQQVRNVGVTAPYMHDGTLQTLWDVIDHYNKGGEANAYLDGGIEPLALTEAEIDQLVAFLFSLTDARLGSQNQQEFDRQKKVATERRPIRDTALATRQTLPFEKTGGKK